MLRPLTPSEQVLIAQFYEFGDIGLPPLISPIIRVAGFGETEDGVFLVLGTTVIVTTIDDITVFSRFASPVQAEAFVNTIFQHKLPEYNADTITKEELKEAGFVYYDKPIRFGYAAISKPIE